jgi:hypothetical protein
MASLKAVYGDTYDMDIKTDYINHVVNLYANNIANKEFILTYNSSKMWVNCNLPQDIITNLIITAQNLNPKIRLTHVNKNSKYINIFPALIKGAVEYFILTDLKENVFYSLYITPDKMSVF